MINYITPEDKPKTFTFLGEKITIPYYSDDTFKIFLAGTIDNGESDDWQREVYLHLTVWDNTETEYRSSNRMKVTMFSPRRNNWKEDATQEDIEEQIKWEQEKLDEADLIVMVLQDNSKSPISLLELGLYGPQGKMVVFCTDKFYRFSNVKLTCEKFLIPLYETTDKVEIASKIYDLYNEIVWNEYKKNI